MVHLCHHPISFIATALEFISCGADSRMYPQSGCFSGRRITVTKQQLNKRCFQVLCQTNKAAAQQEMLSSSLPNKQSLLLSFRTITEQQRYVSGFSHKNKKTNSCFQAQLQQWRPIWTSTTFTGLTGWHWNGKLPCHNKTDLLPNRTVRRI